MKIRAAEQKFNISESILRKRLKERNSTCHVPLVRKPIFIVDEEKKLTNLILNLA